MKPADIRAAVEAAKEAIKAADRACWDARMQADRACTIAKQPHEDKLRRIVLEHEDKAQQLAIAAGATPYEHWGGRMTPHHQVPQEDGLLLQWDIDDGPMREFLAKWEDLAK